MNNLKPYIKEALKLTGIFLGVIVIASAAIVFVAIIGYTAVTGEFL